MRIVIYAYQSSLTLLVNCAREVREALERAVGNNKLNIHYVNMDSDSKSSSIFITVIVPNTWEVKNETFGIKEKILNSLKEQSWQQMYRKTIEPVLDGLKESDIHLLFDGESVSE